LTTRRGWDWAAARSLCVRQAQAVLGPGAAAEDAAQEALVRAWRMRAKCRTPEAPGPWLTAIARREALRAAARRREAPLEEAPPPAAPSHEPRAVLRLTVAAAVATLPEDDRRLLSGRYWKDLSQPEIADRLDMTEGAVRVRLHRIRARLRENLSEL
jgi:RNA polymerase sigma factor (sigma-70 family)